MSAVHRFPYRMNYIYLGFFLVLLSFAFYGVWFGRSDWGFASTPMAKLLSALALAVPVTVALRPPRLRHVVLEKDHIIVPHLFNPFVCHQPVPLAEITRVRDEGQSDWLGLPTIVLVTPRRSVRIYPGFLRRSGRRSREAVETSLMLELAHAMDRVQGRGPGHVHADRP